MSTTSTGNRLAGARSMRVRLALAFGALAGALAVALSLILGYYASAVAREEISRRLAHLAVEYRDKLDTSLAERMDDIVTLAYLDTATVDGAQAERRAARIEQLMRNRDFVWVGYANPAGQVEASAGRMLQGENVSGRPWFRAAQKEPALLDAHEAVLLSKLLPPSAEPRRFVDLAVPIAGGRGVVGAHLNFAWAGRLRDDTQRTADSQSPFELLLTSSDGTVLIGPAALVGQKVPLPLGARVGAPAAIERWPDGEDYLAGGSPMRGIGGGLNLGWISIAREPARTAFAPVSALQSAILWAGLALALAGIAAGWLLATRLARPLESLAEAAQSIARGEHRVTLPRLSENLEMQRLSEALRAMLSHLREQAESLREAQDRLDQRVRERTAELVKLQAQLELEVADTMVARDDAANSNEQLALALDASRLALWDYDVERDQVFLSPSWSKMLGGPAVETRIGSVALAQLVPEAARGRVAAEVQRVLTGALDEYRIEHPVTRRDGSEIWIVSTGRVVGRGADGRVLRIVGTNRDVTERVHATAALRNSEERFRRAFDNPAVGVALVAPDGRFQAVNRTMQKMLGYTEAELLATTFRALTHPDDLAENQALVEETLQGLRDSYEYEKRFLRKDGTPLWVQVNVALVRDEQDLPQQLVCQILDISARHAAEAKLKELVAREKILPDPSTTSKEK
jgi:PAS domain S-box-containing protein